MTIVLNQTGNNINPSERVKINQNWNRIVQGLTRIQLQLDSVAGEDFEEVIRRFDQANNLIQELEPLIDEARNVNQLATQAVDSATQAVNTATDAARNIEGWGTTTEWNSSTSYITNNTVTYNGETYQALSNNTNVVPTTVSTWIKLAARGQNGSNGGGVVQVAPYASSTSPSAILEGETIFFDSQNGGTGLIADWLTLVGDTGTSRRIIVRTIKPPVTTEFPNTAANTYQEITLLSGTETIGVYIRVARTASAWQQVRKITLSTEYNALVARVEALESSITT